MGATYTRQSSFSDGDTINANLFNNEYDQLVSAFNNSTGHTHDGTAGEGGLITKIGPTQDIIVSGTTVLPKTTNAIDLGSATYKFKDAYFAGNITADGSITYNGNVVLGSDSTDTVTINGTIQGGSLLFEGATADAFETTLAIPDATADITITLPNATDTLVGKATTDTLTNKTLTSPTINTATITGNTTFSDGAYDFNIASHDGTNGLKLGGTLVTATATELNIIDGVTATTAELNIMDGVTATAAELNILDGVTSTAAELNIMDGVTATAAELNILDGVTATATELNLIDGVTATTAEINYVDGVTSSIQTQMDTKAPLASPTLTGTPLAPTATAGTNTTQVATTAFVTSAVTSEDTLVEMNDVTITSVADNDIIAYDSSTSKYINQSASEAGVATASDLTSHTGSTSNPHSVTATQVSLGNVTNESKATMFTSPTLTGTPLSTTAVAGTNNTQIATTAFVTAAVSSEDTLAEMNDTTISTPADSDFLVYTGSAWVNETGATARTSLGVDAAGTINYTHPTSAGNKHIPTGGASGQFLKYDSSGTAVWAADNDTVYTHPTTAGDKHIPTGGASGQFLKYDSSGTAVWAADNDTVYTLSTASASVLGGIKVGTNLSIASGVLSSTDTNTTYLGGTGITLTGTTFATDYGTTSGTAAEGNHTHSGYETEGTAVAMAIALG